ncbi:2-dehydropantoate 2-reductase N-terminal domain-containing protein [Streptomyces asiaticus]
MRIDPAQADGAVDLVFLAVKATQVEVAAPRLTALCGADTVVCVLQNGVEQESMVAPHLSGAWNTRNGVVRRRGRDGTCPRHNPAHLRQRGKRT